MSQLIRSRRQHGAVVTAVVTLTIVMFLCVPANAQLSRSDIATLQQRAEQEGWTFTVGYNTACDYSLDQLCGENPALAPRDVLTDPEPAGDRDLPERFDWRDSVCMPPARDQAGCGSCWAFASSGMLECQIVLKDNEVVDLSEQWLLSCNPYGYNCEDGGFDISQMFLNTNDDCGDNGAVLEADFPYIEANGTCGCPYDHHYWIESHANTGTTTAAIKQAIVDYGPVKVSVRANETTWPAYSGGVYNIHESGSTNHAVVLVGWDDTQGTSGVWFMRNSWGSWGENNGYTACGRGYMRIEYGCCSIGSSPHRLYYQPVEIVADQTLGVMPMTVQFTAVAPRDTVVDATWSFGDGQYGYGSSITHVYNQCGIFDVVSIIETPRGTMHDTNFSFIAVHADTMRVPQVEATAAGQPVKVDVYVRNFLPLTQITVPFDWTGSLDIVYDSFSTAGLRTQYFNGNSQANYDITNERATIRLKPGTQPPLTAGAGPVVSLWFTLPAGAPSGSNPVMIADYAAFKAQFICSAGTYYPTRQSGAVIYSATCCVDPYRGNIDASPDEAVNMGDLTVLIDNLFISYAPLLCDDEGNVDLSPGGTITMGDLTVLIDHLFISYAPLPACP